MSKLMSMCYSSIIFNGIDFYTVKWMIQLLFRYFELKLSYMCRIIKNSIFFTLLMILFSSQCLAALSENELIDQLRSDYRVLQQAKGDLQRARRSDSGTAASAVSGVQDTRRAVSPRAEAIHEMVNLRDTHETSFMSPGVHAGQCVSDMMAKTCLESA